MTHPTVIFFRTKDNNAKIRFICKQIQEMVLKEKKVLIRVPSQEVAQYIDTLLWRFPEESFLPHSISSKKTNDKVVITELEQNLNQATCLLNLCPNVSPIYTQFEEIYELYDETHPQKMELSQQKQKEYNTLKVAFIEK